MPKTILFVTVSALLLAGCTRNTPSERAKSEAESAATAGQPQRVEIQMFNREGSSIGTVTAENVSGGVRFYGKVTGIKPGQHGFHIHSAGRCDPPDFTTAGGHFNPTSAHHGIDNPQTPKPHIGDLGNLTVGEDGVANIDATASNTTLGEGPNTLMMADGTALVIHANPDDNRSDPSGNAGDRIACGVIHKAGM